MSAWQATLSDEQREAYRAEMRRRGKAGGNARAEALTERQRRAGARKAAKARWLRDRSRKLMGSVLIGAHLHL
jgi:hypothetical protein